MNCARQGHWASPLASGASSERRQRLPVPVPPAGGALRVQGDSTIAANVKWRPSWTRTARTAHAESATNSRTRLNLPLPHRLCRSHYAPQATSIDLPSTPLPAFAAPTPLELTLDVPRASAFADSQANDCSAHCGAGAGGSACSGPPPNAAAPARPRSAPGGSQQDLGHHHVHIRGWAAPSRSGASCGLGLARDMHWLGACAHARGPCDLNVGQNGGVPGLWKLPAHPSRRRAVGAAAQADLRADLRVNNDLVLHIATIATCMHRAAC